MNKIIFFDLDGTLRQTKSGKTFINEPADQEPIPGTQKALAYYQNKGFILIGITNQGGVAEGHKSLQNAIEEQRITLQLFPQLSEIYFCPNYDGESCYQLLQNGRIREFKSPDISCRKPSHGMISVATSPWAMAKSPDFNNSWMIGDRPEDRKCAAAAGIKFVWASLIHTMFQPEIKKIPCTHTRFQPEIKKIPYTRIDLNILIKFLSI